MHTLVVRSVLFGLLLVMGGSSLRAQAFDFMFFGTVGGGVAAYDNGAFSNRLKSYRPVRQDGELFLYQTEDFSTTGWTADASLGALVSGDLVIGVSGQQVFYPTIRSINGPGNPRDEYTLSGRGVGLDLGYAVMNSSGTVLYPYVQGGYYGYELEYANNQTEAIPFFEGKPVAAGSTVTYSGWAPRLALGIGLVRALGNPASEKTSGGLALGVRLSWGQMPSRPEWQEPDGSVVNNGGLTPAYNGVSLVITLGGGLWSFY